MVTTVTEEVTLMIPDDVYPAVVQSQRTLLNDDDLIDAVRAGCGDDVADALRNRLEKMHRVMPLASCGMC